MSRSSIPFILILSFNSVQNGLLAAEPQTGQRVVRPIHSKLFRHQYSIYDLDFCASQVCADFDNDGRRELIYASRDSGLIQQLDAADGTVRWSRHLPGQQQSTMAFDVNHDGRFEILYSVSNPGQLYLLSGEGELLSDYDSGDGKLGNSAVILDGDHDGRLDAYFGSRSRYLIRLELENFTQVAKRPDWVQCGCYTTAMDVDHDGRWDLFAGSGDDHAAKGVLHRIDPVTLDSIWSFDTNDNASSADPVLVDIDGDEQVEIIKSVDNYAKDESHDAVYALETDGTLLWKVPGLSGEDSPNVADLDADGEVEIVGMTFGGEVYCLNADGTIRWRNDLRPKLDNGQHMYMAPILCDLDGDSELEILAMTNGQYSKIPNTKPIAQLFALDAQGNVLDRFDLEESRFWGHAFVCNIDEDPFLELVVSGSGGLDVIETKGLGPYSEHFQRRRSYQRLNVIPWQYADSYFIHRGQKSGVANLTDNLVLQAEDGQYLPSGSFTTELLIPPPGLVFDEAVYSSRQPPGTTVQLNILAGSGTLIHKSVRSGTKLRIEEPVRLQFLLSTKDPSKTPVLDAYKLSFNRP